MIQIYFLKKNFDVQKAERWFRERKIPVQMVDLSRARLGRRELESVRRSASLNAMIDTESRAFKECPARYSGSEEALFSALLETPAMLRLPIVRDGSRATVGFAPETWEAWAK